MRLKFLNYVFLLALSASTISLASINNQNINNSYIKTNKQDTTTKYDEMWTKSIKESSENESIKLFFTRDASLAYQQSVLVAEYMILDNLNTSNAQNNSSKDDDILFFYNYTLYEQNKWNTKNWEDKYVNNSDRGGSNFKIIDNTSKLDSSYNSNYMQYPDTNIVSDLLSYYQTQKKDNNFTFDIWIVDGALEDFWKNNSDNYDFIKHINKIYILTDGNYQTYYFINNAKARWQSENYTQLTEEEIEAKFKSYKADTNDDQKNDFEKYTLYDFINDGNIFTFFHTHSYTESPYYAIPNITLYKTYEINYNYYDFVQNNVQESDQNTFIQDYENFFLISEEKSLTDFFVRNGSSYDPKKKNVIWFGDSLVTDVSQIYPQKTDELQSIMQSWLKMFPSSEYNFILKPHPRYTIDQQVQLTKWLIKSDDDSNIIYFSTTPWEMVLSWNYKMQKANSSTYKGMFSEDMAKSSDNVFLWYQFTNTTIQTTAFFLADSYNYTIDDIEKTLNSYYFPLPETFDVVARTTSFSIEPKEQLEINKQKIKDIYQPFVEINAYPDYTKDQISATDFIRQNYNSQYSINLNLKNKSSDGLSTENIIIISVVVPIVVIALIATGAFVAKHQKYKKFKRIKI